jgi:CRP-like cAMP-binding protein
VTARGDCTVLEIGAAEFRAYVQNHPEILEHLATAAASRRRALDQSRAAHAGAGALEHVTLVQRMRRFFGLS